MTTSVQMCGFEASWRADLRADFGVFADTKYRELPGACCYEFTQLHNGSTIELAPRMLPSFAQLRAEKIVTRQNRYPRAP